MSVLYNTLSGADSRQRIERIVRKKYYFITSKRSAPPHVDLEDVLQEVFFWLNLLDQLLARLNLEVDLQDENVDSVASWLAGRILDQKVPKNRVEWDGHQIEPPADHSDPWPDESQVPFDEKARRAFKALSDEQHKLLKISKDPALKGKERWRVAGYDSRSTYQRELAHAKKRLWEAYQKQNHNEH